MSYTHRKGASLTQSNFSTGWFLRGSDDECRLLRCDEGNGVVAQFRENCMFAKGGSCRRSASCWNVNHIDTTVHHRFTHHSKKPLAQHMAQSFVPLLRLIRGARQQMDQTTSLSEAASVLVDYHLTSSESVHGCLQSWSLWTKSESCSKWSTDCYIGPRLVVTHRSVECNKWSQHVMTLPRSSRPWLAKRAYKVHSCQSVHLVYVHSDYVLYTRVLFKVRSTGSRGHDLYRFLEFTRDSRRGRLWSI